MFDEKLFDGNPSLKLKVLPTLPDNPEEGMGRFPSWLHRKIPRARLDLMKTGEILKKYHLNTVCEEAKCPNRMECYSQSTATFLALGKECTRSCGFCDIDFSKTPKALEEDEPYRIAAATKDLGLKHVVITMVARDDLPDGGADQIGKILRKIRELVPDCAIEVLVSDFAGNLKAVDRVLEEHPLVFNHNLETVRALSPKVRHKATYDRTLSLLRYVKASGMVSFVKSGIMVGLGETESQVEEALADLKEAGCDIVTIGQYLQASSSRLRVKSFVAPEQFKKYEEFGLSIGLNKVFSGPFVRSSYHAGEVASFS